MTAAGRLVSRFDARLLMGIGIGLIGLSFFIMSRSEIGAAINVRLMLREASLEWLKRLMKIGIPACVQDLSWVGGNFVLFLIFEPDGLAHRWRRIKAYWKLYPFSH